MGKNKWLNLFSAEMLLQFPKSEWMKRGVMFKQALSWATYICFGRGPTQWG